MSGVLGMNIRNPFLQAAVMVAIALLIALIANGVASRQRKLVLPGYYPNALRVPPRVPVKVPPPVSTEAVPVETEQSPAPGQPPVEILTSTIERPAGETTTSVAPIAAPQGDPRQSAATAPGTSPPAPAQQPQQDPLARFKPTPDRPSVDISGADAALLHARGALFLDARRTSVYEEGHIAGARNFSVWESDIDDKVNRLYGERSDPEQQDLPIVIYCSGGDCEDSHMLAQKLWGIQFNNVYVYKDGYPDWQRRNGAVRKGGQP
ncbi:MAG TPA: rhodanese-like domain-containing protein [Thermoanaerobaculia bacterium]